MTGTPKTDNTQHKTALQQQALPKLGFLYLDHVWQFFSYSNFKGWPDKIEAVTYHWKNDKERFINEVKKKKIEVLIGNIPSTAYETFKEIAKSLPDVRFVPSIESQFANKSKENVTLFCQQHDLPIPETYIFYNEAEGFDFLNECEYPKIVKRSYGPSNYGGYYVHKVDSKEEAINLFQKKRYMPMYIQDCIPLTADIRVMLIGHRPVCAFWRVAGEGEWITNTSQGGYMNYSGVPQEALDIAVAASKAADAEFWACDIAESDGNYYILECATAFAAFPYIRDWIAQYLMWDFSNGRFPKPNIPLYHWEELGKMSSSILRKMRHIEFSNEIQPSADGEIWHEGYDQYPMSITAGDEVVDLPEIPYSQQAVRLAENLVDKVENVDVISEAESVHIGDETQANTNDSLAITAHQLKEQVVSEGESSSMTLVEVDIVSDVVVIDKQEVTTPVEKKEEQKRTGINIAMATQAELMTLTGIGEKRAKQIIEYREAIGGFTEVQDILKISGISERLYARFSAEIYVE